MLEITAALSAVHKIVTEDMIPAVIGDVSTIYMIVLIYIYCSVILQYCIYLLYILPNPCPILWFNLILPPMKYGFNDY